MLIQGHCGPGSGPILIFLTTDSDSSLKNTENMCPQIQCDFSFSYLAPINAMMYTFIIFINFMTNYKNVNYTYVPILGFKSKITERQLNSTAAALQFFRFSLSNDALGRKGAHYPILMQKTAFFSIWCPL